jgi:hypothetical protein
MARATSLRCPGLTIFFAYRLQNPVFEQGFGEHLLELTVFALQLLELASLTRPPTKVMRQG